MQETEVVVFVVKKLKVAIVVDCYDFVNKEIEQNDLEEL